MARTVWGRYTKFARRAVFFAQEEARSRGEARVRPDHLLLGLLVDERNNAVQLLRRIGIEPEILRERLLANLPAPQVQKRVAEMLFSETSIQATRVALQEAEADGRGFGIGTESLLRGLLAGNPVLAELGCTADRIREEFLIKGLRRESRSAPRPIAKLLRWWRS